MLAVRASAVYLCSSLAKARLREGRGKLSHKYLGLFSGVSMYTLGTVPSCHSPTALKASHIPTCRFWKNAKKLALLRPCCST